MENESQLYIERYIDGGGILGAHLGVNEDAASTVLRDTELSCDVYLARGDRESTSYNIYGSDTLEAVKSNAVFHNEPIKGATKTSQLREIPEGWEITIFDQELHHEVDDRMRKKYKAQSNAAGSDVYNEMFVKRLNKDTALNIGKASTIDKNYTLVETAKMAGKNDLLIALGVGTSYLGGRWTLENGRSYFLGLTGFEELDYEGLIKFAVGTGLLRFSLREAAIIVEREKRTEYKFWETIVPNIQPRARVKAWKSLRANGDALIKFLKS